MMHSARLSRKALVAAAGLVAATTLIGSGSAIAEQDTGVAGPQPAHANWQQYVQGTSGPAYPVRVVSTSGQVSNADALTQPDTGATTIISRASGDPAPTIVLDYGQDVGGVPVFGVQAVSSTPSLQAGYAEVLRFLTPNGDGGTPFQSGDPARSDTYQVAGPGTITNQYIQGGERYQEITLQSAGSVTLSFVRINTTTYPDTPGSYGGNFLSSSSELNKLWYAGTHTLALNMLPPNSPDGHGHLIMDGAKRDRDVWEGDLSVEAPTLFYSFGASEYVRDSLRLLGSYQLQSGFIEGRRAPGDPVNTTGLLPGTVSQYSASYSMYFVANLATYYLYTGDLAFVRDEWPIVQRELAWNAQQLDAQGLFETNASDGNNWHYDDQTGAQTYYNALYHRILGDAAGMATALGDPSAAAGYATQATAVKDAVNQYLYDPTTGVYNISTTQSGFWSIQDGYLRDTGGDTGLLKTGSDWTDYTMSFRTRINGQQSGFVVRGASNDTKYLLILDDSADRVGKPNVVQEVVFNGGSIYHIADLPVPAPIEPGTWHAVSVAVRGTTVSTSVDGALVGSFDSTTFPPGAQGIPAGTVGFREDSGIGEQTDFSDLTVTAPDGTVLYQNPLTDPATLADFQVPGDTSDSVAQDANTFAILYGIAPAERVPGILAAMSKALGTAHGDLSVSSPAPAGYHQVIGPFMGSYELWARFAAGDTPGAFSLLDREWGQMVAGDPGGVLWEVMGPDGTVHTPGINGTGDGATSMAHGWSTGPTSALSQYVLGIAPDSPGYRTWSVVPHPGELTWAQGQAPTPHGALSVAWSHETRRHRFSLNVTPPAGTTGTIAVPLFGSPAVVHVNGRLAWADGSFHPAPGVTAAVVKGDYLQLSVTGGSAYDVTSQVTDS